MTTPLFDAIFEFSHQLYIHNHKLFLRPRMDEPWTMSELPKGTFPHCDITACLTGLLGHCVYLDHFDIVLDNDYFDKWATSHLRPWNAMPFGTTKGLQHHLLLGKIEKILKEFLHSVIEKSSLILYCNCRRINSR